MLAQFTRTGILLGADKLEDLANKHIVVAGVGGVGGYVVESLVRAGVGKLTLIDHDVVDITNLNRQLIATLENVGQAKVREFARRIAQINPQIQLEVVQEFITAENLAQLLPTTLAPDYVIDCIDTIDSKVALILYCLGQQWKIVSSMGAGNRIDVTKVHLADIGKTKGCALARNIRQRLRKDGVFCGLRVVYSEEEPHAKPQLVSGSRPINGTISYLPALFGIMLAGEVIAGLLT